MKNITYINAGAGSGKTYTLTERLASLIEKEHIQPEQVILTTFTTKAAGEFREKAKGMLIERGLQDEAVRLDQALVGTVHSVANALINKFWFKLGLPPHMGVMAEEDVEFYVSQSLSNLPTDSEFKTLNAFVREFDVEYSYNSKKKGLNYDVWKDHLKSIIDFSTNYEITDFTRSREQSLAYVRKFVEEGKDIHHTALELRELLKEHQATLDAIKDSKANNDRKDALRELSYGVDRANVTWYAKLSSLLQKTEKKNGPLASAFCEELQDLWHSRLVCQKQEEYIVLLFELAARWQRRFAEFKRERRVLDYNDMEKYLLRLTEIPSAREELSLSFRYLFVDEFQDSSPIQVKIFDRLSELVEHSYWVGDYKQSIYGFRGSDLALVKAVVDNVSGGGEGCSTETLTTSYRSLPDIVEVCNRTFKQTFKNILDEENIVLNQKRQNTEGRQSLRYVTADEDTDCTIQLAEQIAWLIQNEQVAPSDIAVICRTNKPLELLADCLQNAPLCVPTDRGTLPAAESNAALLVQALLQIVVSDSNSLAKAAVAWLTVKGFGTAALIDSKLMWDSEGKKAWEFLNDVPLVASLLAKRKMLRQQGLAAMVETMVIELGLYDVVKQWPDPSWSEACLDVLVHTAADYEQHCRQMGMPATVSGYLDHLAQTAPTVPGDARGVRLHTYHSCKGLQWKHVFLCSLNDHPADEKRIVRSGIYGVNACHEKEPTAEQPYPEVYIRLVPYVYGKYQVPPDIFAQIQNDDSGEYPRLFRQAIEETNRLLYVGMTRAADVLTLVVEKPKKGIKTFQWPVDIGLQPNDDAVGDFRADLLGTGMDFLNVTANCDQLGTLEPYESADAAYDHKRLARAPGDADGHEPRDIAPSSVTGTMEVSRSQVIGERIPLNGAANLDYAEVGDCVHQTFCALDRQRDPQTFAAGVVAAYGFGKVLPDSGAIVEAWQRLKAALTAEYGNAVAVHHERPFQMLTADGHVVSGSMDLVWETARGSVLVDFKTNPMAAGAILDPKNKHYVGLYGGQLWQYKQALEAAGETVLGVLVYYPVGGLLVELNAETYVHNAQVR